MAAHFVLSKTEPSAHSANLRIIFMALAWYVIQEPLELTFL